MKFILQNDIGDKVCEANFDKDTGVNTVECDDSFNQTEQELRAFALQMKKIVKLYFKNSQTLPDVKSLDVVLTLTDFDDDLIQSDTV